MPELAVVLQVLRANRRQALLVGAGYAAVVYTSTAGYLSAYHSVAQRIALQATLGHDRGLAALFGTPRTLATPGGFTAWRSVGVLVIVGAVWGMFAGTRILRGDEEDGRVDLIAAAPMSRRRVTAVTVLAAWTVALLPAVPALIGTLAATRFGDAGFGARSAAFLALVLAVPAVFFVSVGALASQIAPRRRQATAITGTVLGICYLARVAAGGAPQARWLMAIDPLGWVDRAAPLTGSRWPWLVLALCASAALCVGAVALSGVRDLGAGLFPAHDRRAPRTALLGSPAALAVRTAGGPFIAWTLPVVALCGVTAALARPVADATARSPGMRQLLARQGDHLAGPLGFLGLTMVPIATVVTLAAVHFVGAVRGEETEGTLDTLLAAPLRRRRWYAARTAVSATAVVLIGLTAGVTSWAVTSMAGVHLGATRALQAGLNGTVPALVVLGVALAGYGLTPRRAAALGYALTAWSFLVQMVGTTVKAPAWLLDLSVVHHMAPAPAVPPNWSADAVMLLAALLAAAVGGATFTRRDLVPA